MADADWEQGSYFHQLDSPADSGTRTVPTGACMYASGRAALSALVRYRGWARVWLPTYSCPDIVQALAGVTLGFYEDLPFDAPPLPPPALEGEAIVVVNFFGCRSQRDYAAFADLPAALIEDHTHDPWSTWATSSRAEYAFASLRKTLPIPDGGALWSPASAALPASPQSIASAAAVMSDAMALKRAYLDGADVPKQAFLAAFREAERRFRIELGHGAMESTRTLVARFPVERWRDLRRRNHAVLANELRDLDPLTAREPAACPFSFVVLLPNHDLRERLRSYLRGRSVYPAVLWPFEERHRPWAGDRAIELSGRMMSIHCDGRYGVEDMRRVAGMVQQFLRKEEHPRRRIRRDGGGDG